MTCKCGCKSTVWDATGCTDGPAQSTADPLTDAMEALGRMEQDIQRLGENMRNLEHLLGMILRSVVKD